MKHLPDWQRPWLKLVENARKQRSKKNISVKDKEQSLVTDSEVAAINGFVQSVFFHYGEMQKLLLAPNVIRLKTSKSYRKNANGFFEVTDDWALAAVKLAQEDYFVKKFLDELLDISIMNEVRLPVQMRLLRTTAGKNLIHGKGKQKNKYLFRNYAIWESLDFLTKHCGFSEKSDSARTRFCSTIIIKDASKNSVFGPLPQTAVQGVSTLSKNDAFIADWNSFRTNIAYGSDGKKISV